MPSNDLIPPVIQRPTGPPLRQVKDSDGNRQGTKGDKNTNHKNTQDKAEANEKEQKENTKIQQLTDHEIDLFV
ncbi:hypothetical protein [Celerinatantimonas diazotrophica]|uniref:Uncharacterized protein n=1 Tax=Celerinatantimonas diazotrophica TaxID=412034 RepID=A0A4R1JAF3_9GAMM|nr:hypothetical protein [Celerinatantimonas diazotrophica]TCK47612.1 hypothetical protein EV690_2649 [Celerinatantimonas diazotrophica]CAG9296765.1 hypothetical protein CEDIAZO_01922 [Celerinatantimonas diazotrophica]